MPTTPLTIAFVSPVLNATVKGIVYVQAATHGQVSTVTFTVDGASYGEVLKKQPYGWCWDTRNLEDGTHTLSVVASNKGQQVTATLTVVTRQGVPPPPPTDTTPPVVAITAPAPNATINGTVTVSATATDNVAVARVVFQANGAVIGTVLGTGPYAISWPTGADGVYVLTAVAIDVAGNSATSTPVSVTVTQIVIDHTPPVVSVTSPVTGATVSGTRTLSATATDNVAVAGVVFILDGVQLGAPITAPPYTLSWDTTTAPNGAHTIAALATDTAGNTTTATAVPITVSNVAPPLPDTTPPTVNLTAPANGATVSGTVLLTANAADNIAIASVQFRANGVLLGVVTAFPFVFPWLTGANGSYTLTAVATDTSGNVTTSGPIAVTVTQVIIDPTPPTVSITFPVNGATVSGTVNLQATAADNVGVTGVTFKAGGVPIGTVTTAPYILPWVTPASGSVVLTAVATDAAGNSTTSAAVTVTVHQPDTTPPVVTLTAPSSGATIHGVVTVSATATDNVGIAKVEFFRGLGGDVSLGVVTGAGPYSVSWSTGANGTAVLTAKATDTAGNFTISSPVSVTIQQIVVDTTPPTVSFISPTPANGATVSGNVTLTATAADNVAVASVAIRVNSTPIALITSAPYTTTWVTGANGTYTIDAVATDTAGNVTTTPTRTITVAQPDTTAPVVSLTSPVNGATVQGTVVLQATATDNVGVTLVRFRVNNVVIGTTTLAPYKFNWVTGVNGAMTLDAQAVDAVGNVGTSTTITVTVNNIVVPPPDLTPPTVSITSPANGATITTSTTIQATASDNVGVVGVQFKAGGVNLGAEVTAPPYSRLFDITGKALGAYSFTAVARDAAGNSTTSATVSVTLAAPAPLPAGLLTQANLVYQGAFRVPSNFPSDGVSFNYGGGALTFDAARGALWMGGFILNGLVGEISIPTIRTGALNTLVTASMVQPLTDILRGKRTTVNGDTSNGVFIGGLLPIGGNLIVTAYTYYDGPGLQSISHFKASQDFTQTTVVGPVQVTNQLGLAGFVFGYMCPIPVAWQSALGGAYFTGACDRAIIGRTSLGPSLTVFNPLQVGVVSPVPGTTVLGYPITHPTIGNYNSPPGYLYNGAAQVEGVVFPEGSSSVLFFGRNSTAANNFCYGAGTTNPALHKQPVPNEPGVIYCYDLADQSKGTHGYPYQSFVWAYDANDLVKVKQGLKQPWEIVPYASWAFTTPYQVDDGKVVMGAAYNPATQQIFLSMAKQDGATPVIHVFKVV